MWLTTYSAKPPREDFHMNDLTRLIRDHLGESMDPASHALLAVVDKCEEMRTDFQQHGTAGRFTADEFETVIAHSLGLIDKSH